MTGKKNILILSALLICIVVGSLFAAKTKKQPLLVPNNSQLLKDGTLISASSGQLIKQNEKWFFKFDTDVNDITTTIKAGTSMEMLPSSALQEMLDISKASKVSKFKLWSATVTIYKNQNFLFPIYSMPISEPNTAPAPTPKPAAEPNAPKTQKPSAADIDDPNDVLSVPAEIKKRLDPTRIIRPAQLIPLPTTTPKYDSTMADRTGFIVETDPNSFQFVFDEVGRNIEKISIPLLPCQILELSTLKQKEEIEPIRFKIAGKVTFFENKYYLLLQRAAPTYSHGNFNN